MSEIKEEKYCFVYFTVTVSSMNTKLLIFLKPAIIKDRNLLRFGLTTSFKFINCYDKKLALIQEKIGITQWLEKSF